MIKMMQLAIVDVLFVLLLICCWYNTEAFQISRPSLSRILIRTSKRTDLFMKKNGESEAFFCESCGTEYIKWMGRCSACKEWNTIKTFRPARDSFVNVALDPRTLAQLPTTKTAAKAIPRSTAAGSAGRWVSSDSSANLIPLNTILSMDGGDPKSKNYRDPERVMLFSNELNRVLGGGLVKGSVILITGEPGVGKSTLLLQLAGSMTQQGQHKLPEITGKKKNPVKESSQEVIETNDDVDDAADESEDESLSSVVYISGEENARQIAMRAKRLQLPQDNLFLICDSDIDNSLISITQARKLPSLIIVDSVQTMKTSYTTSPSAGVSGPGSTSQVRDVTARLVQFAKSTGKHIALHVHCNCLALRIVPFTFIGVPIVIVGHVTKTGDVAGPRILEHMVDTVLYIEGSSNSNDDYRLIRSEKNRFGSVAEVGVFCMTEKGMEDVSNPSALFLTSTVMQDAQEGAAVVIVMEGTR